ncbi:hypothetical protein LXL04_018757 [Taraxacum kok-saghyz]
MENDTCQKFKWVGIKRFKNKTEKNRLKNIYIMEALTLSDLKPISLIGCAYKIVAKIHVDRLKTVVDNDIELKSVAVEYEAERPSTRRAVRREESEQQRRCNRPGKPPAIEKPGGVAFSGKPFFPASFCSLFPAPSRYDLRGGTKLRATTALAAEGCIFICFTHNITDYPTRAAGWSLLHRQNRPKPQKDDWPELYLGWSSPWHTSRMLDMMFVPFSCLPKVTTNTDSLDHRLTIIVPPVATTLGSFENSYIPENPRTPKPLTFSKNRLRGAKNRSNISPLHICTKNKKSCTYAKVKKKYRFFGKNFQRIVMIKNVLEGSEVGFLKGITVWEI